MRLRSFLFLAGLASGLASGLSGAASAQSSVNLGLIAAPVPATAGQDVTLTAFASARDRQAPTGSVTFHDGATLLGTQTLQAIQPGWMQVSNGGLFSCAVTVEGAAVCWGANFLGQLGDGTTTRRGAPTPVQGLGSGVVAVAAGSGHACALIDDGSLRCWGDNPDGELGNGTTVDSLVPVTVTGLPNPVVQVVAGNRFTCALDTAGAVLCWGNNFDGQLGDGTTTDRSVPTPVSGLGSGVARVATGNNHACAITTAGAALCWGWNLYGQLGDGTTTSRLVPTPVSGLGAGVEDIDGGARHTCALRNSGTVWCWGLNHRGQLGTGDTVQSLTPVQVPLLYRMVALGVGYDNSCAVHVQGQVRCWGANGFGQIGDGTSSVITPGTLDSTLVATSLRFSEVSVGSAHTCAQDRSGGVWCWGNNDQHQLGIGGGAGNLPTPRAVNGGRFAMPYAHAFARLVTDTLPQGRRALRVEYAGSVDHQAAVSRNRRLLVAAP